MAEFVDIYSRLPQQSLARIEKVQNRLESPGGEEELLRDHISRLRRVLRETLGNKAAPYEPQSFGRKPMTPGYRRRRSRSWALSTKIAMLIRQMRRVLID